VKDDLIGKVIHFYDGLGVAIVRLDKKIKVSDKLKFVKGDNSFEQEISSMQIEHKPILEGKKGEEVGIKVNQKISNGSLVYLI